MSAKNPVIFRRFALIDRKLIGNVIFIGLLPLAPHNLGTNLTMDDRTSWWVHTPCLDT